MIFFGPRVHRWEKLGRSGKTPPGDRAEIENVKYAKGDVFNFNPATQVALFNFYSTFPIYGPLPKKVSFRFVIRLLFTNFTGIKMGLDQKV